VCLVSQSGYIYSKASAQLVLGLSEQKISAQLSHPVSGRSETRVSGLVVGVQKKVTGCATQLWTFTTDGNICCQVSQSISHAPTRCVSHSISHSPARCVSQSISHAPTRCVSHSISHSPARCVCQSATHLPCVLIN